MTIGRNCLASFFLLFLGMSVLLIPRMSHASGTGARGIDHGLLSGIFADGFESEGTCAWSVTNPLIVFYQDSDGDGFGDPTESLEDCEPLAGFVSNNEDCDDSSNRTFPGAAPIDSPDLCMKDFDEDGYGDDGSGPFEPGTDCNDLIAAINPGETDICDDVDNDCSGVADQDFLPGGSVTYDGGPYPPDAGLAKGDSCGTGDCAGGLVICDLGGSSLTCSTLVNINPEVCDGADNDCDGSVDEEGSNACGGCATLPADPGDPCGTCGVYECFDQDTVYCNDPCTLVDFGPVPSFIGEGQTAVNTIPDPLVVTLAGPVPSNTFVTVTSINPSIVDVFGGGVTVLQGTNSAQVLLSGVSPGTVNLTASLAGIDLHADVRVFGDAELRHVVALVPAEAWIQISTTFQFDVVLDLPAAIGGSTVDLSLDPNTFGTVQPNVVVMADEISASFDFSAGPVAGTELLTASLGPSNASATINVISGGGLVINEVDYDQPGTDSLEFVEIYNPGSASVNLTDISLVRINGDNNAEYGRIPLSPVSSLGFGEYLVIGSSALLSTVPPSTKTITFALASNNLQNGAPDGLAIIDEASSALIDALSYEGEITAADIAGLGPTNLVEGVATTASDTGDGSLIRSPNGIDTDNAASDWVFDPISTPGAENTP